MIVIPNADGEPDAILLAGTRYTPAGLLAIIRQHAEQCAVLNGLLTAETERRQKAEHFAAQTNQDAARRAIKLNAWAARWKEIAKRYRKEFRQRLDDMMRAGDLEHARTVTLLERVEAREAELLRLGKIEVAALAWRAAIKEPAGVWDAEQVLIAALEEN